MATPAHGYRRSNRLRRWQHIKALIQSNNYHTNPNSNPNPKTNPKQTPGQRLQKSS